MEQSQKNWSKTLLSSYSYLETICGAIDKTVLNFSINSAMSSDAEFVANKIIALTERKKFLINIKVLVDKILRNMDDKLARILVLKFIDGMKSDIASKLMKVSIRTYFRRINIAIDRFAMELKRFGYTDDVLYNLIKDENWIVQIYDAFCQKDFKEFDVDGLKFLSIALTGLNKRSARAY